MTDKKNNKKGVLGRCHSEPHIWQDTMDSKRYFEDSLKTQKASTDLVLENIKQARKRIEVLFDNRVEVEQVVKELAGTNLGGFKIKYYTRSNFNFSNFEDSDLSNHITLNFRQICKDGPQKIKYQIQSENTHLDFAKNLEIVTNFFAVFKENKDEILECLSILAKFETDYLYSFDNYFEKLMEGEGNENK